MRNHSPKTPEHEAVYQRIRDMVLFGEFEPGQPVTILGLTSRIDAGMTPVREAIRRLTAEGALEATGNRRVGVPVMTADKLNEIRIARLAVEPSLAGRAAERSTADLVNRLAAIDATLDDAIEAGDPRRYLQHNYQFHFCLYGAAEAEILLKIARSLWLQIAPSLRIVSGRHGTANLPDKHNETVDALLRADRDAVAEAIAEDITQGMDHVENALLASEFDQIIDSEKI